MDRFDQMRIFVTVVEAQGFAAAARKLKVSPPAVTRAVAGLESDLGVELLRRTTRFVRVTEAGKRYFDDVLRILNEVEMANEAAAGINAEPCGHLRVTAPELFGQLFVIPGIIAYLDRYPKMRVESLFLDRVVNLLEEGLDVGVRIGDLPDSSLRAMRVGAVRMLLVASPAYLDRHPMPPDPEALGAHTCIAAGSGNSSISWRFTYPGGEKLVKVQPRLTTTTNGAAIAAATAGFGITRVLSYQVASELASGRLKIILPEFELLPWPVHVIHQEGRYASTKVRTFIDLLSQRLQRDPALN